MAQVEETVTFVGQEGIRPGEWEDTYVAHNHFGEDHVDSLLTSQNMYLPDCISHWAEE